MMRMTRHETAQFLLSHDRYTILTHRQPDGDTLGSGAGLCRILRKLGKTAHVLENPEITGSFTWLMAGLTKAEVAQGDTVICVDVAASHLLPRGFSPEMPVALRIDHHGGSDSFTQHELVDPTAAACTELIYDLACQLDVALDAAMADALYTGCITDTSCFQFANTTAHTLAVASACVAAGARNAEIYQEIFENRIPQRLKLQSYIGENVDVFAGEKLAIVGIPWSVQEKIGANREDVNNVLNFPQALTRARVAATLLEEKSGIVRLSLRSVKGCSCADVAAAFGGGGHAMASGANLTMKLAEAMEAVKMEMLRQFGEKL